MVCRILFDWPKPTRLVATEPIPKSGPSQCYLHHSTLVRWLQTLLLSQVLLLSTGLIENRSARSAPQNVQEDLSAQGTCWKKDFSIGRIVTAASQTFKKNTNESNEFQWIPKNTIKKRKKHHQTKTPAPPTNPARPPVSPPAPVRTAAPVPPRRVAVAPPRRRSPRRHPELGAPSRPSLRKRLQVFLCFIFLIPGVSIPGCFWRFLSKGFQKARKTPGTEKKT